MIVLTLAAIVTLPLGVLSPPAATGAPPEAGLIQIYAYDGHLDLPATGLTTPERGPPIGGELSTAYSAVDGWSDGASARHGGTPTSLAYTYDDRMPPVQDARVAGTTREARRVSSPSSASLTRDGVAAEGEASLLARANAARDAELSRLTGVRSADRPATVVGAYNARTGNVAVGSSSKVLQECAEACAARNVGGDLADIRFTQAMRPNGSGPPFRDVPVCGAFCEPRYGRGAFPDPLTRFESDL